MKRMLVLAGVVAAAVGCGTTDCTPSGSCRPHISLGPHSAAPSYEEAPMDAVEPDAGGSAEPMPAYPDPGKEPGKVERLPLPGTPKDVPAPPPAPDAAFLPNAVR